MIKIKNRNGLRLAISVTSFLIFILSICSIFFLVVTESYVKEKSEVQELILKKYVSIDAYNILDTQQKYQVSPKSNLVYKKYINDEIIDSLNENESVLFDYQIFEYNYKEDDNNLVNLKLEISLREDIFHNDKYNKLNNIISKTYDFKLLFIPLTLISLFISIYSIYNFFSKLSYKNSRIPIEIIGAIMIFSFILLVNIAELIGVIIFGFILLYLSTLIIRQIKNRTILKQSLLYNLIKKSKENMSLFLWLLLLFSILGITQLYLFARLNEKFTAFIFIANILLFIIVYYHLGDIERLNKSTSRIVNGELDLKIKNNSVFNLFNTLITNLNKLSDSAKEALKKEMQSELMKTELITNVSHDIKIPITSIINYIDLLQNTEDEKEKKQYFDVLNRQSKKLKNLVENLIDISKLTTGNISLNKEELDLNLLLRQMLSEYEEKFAEHKLEVDLNLNENNLSILADGKQITRVFDNLFENIFLYAQNNTRVYITSYTKRNDQIIEIKNISKDRLNISPNELMEKFVREDISRHTNGSGLGLSIAKSIIELHDGTFEINIDGDLFKVIITLK